MKNSQIRILHYRLEGGGSTQAKQCSYPNFAMKDLQKESDGVFQDLRRIEYLAFGKRRMKCRPSRMKRYSSIQNHEKTMQITMNEKCKRLITSSLQMLQFQ